MRYSFGYDFDTKVPQVDRPENCEMLACRPGAEHRETKTLASLTSDSLGEQLRTEVWSKDLGVLRANRWLARMRTPHGKSGPHSAESSQTAH